MEVFREDGVRHSLHHYADQKQYPTNEEDRASTLHTFLSQQLGKEIADDISKYKLGLDSVQKLLCDLKKGAKASEEEEERNSSLLQYPRGDTGDDALVMAPPFGNWAGVLGGMLGGAFGI